MTPMLHGRVALTKVEDFGAELTPCPSTYPGLGVTRSCKADLVFFKWPRSSVGRAVDF